MVHICNPCASESFSIATKLKAGRSKGNRTLQLPRSSYRLLCERVSKSEKHLHLLIQTTRRPRQKSVWQLYDHTSLYAAYRP